MLSAGRVKYTISYSERILGRVRVSFSGVLSGYDYADIELEGTILNPDGTRYVSRKTLSLFSYDPYDPYVDGAKDFVLVAGQVLENLIVTDTSGTASNVIESARFSYRSLSF